MRVKTYFLVQTVTLKNLVIRNSPCAYTDAYADGVRATWRASRTQVRRRVVASSMQCLQLAPRPLFVDLFIFY